MLYAFQLKKASAHFPQTPFSKSPRAAAAAAAQSTSFYKANAAGAVGTSPRGVQPTVDGQARQHRAESRHAVKELCQPVVAFDLSAERLVHEAKALHRNPFALLVSCHLHIALYPTRDAGGCEFTSTNSLASFGQSCFGNATACALKFPTAPLNFPKNCVASSLRAATPGPKRRWGEASKKRLLLVWKPTFRRAFSRETSTLQTPSQRSSERRAVREFAPREESLPTAHMHFKERRGVARWKEGHRLARRVRRTLRVRLSRAEATSLKAGSRDALSASLHILA